MENYIDRDLMEQVKKWIGRREIYVIKGPRQCGKTTLLQMLKEWLMTEKSVDSDHIISLSFEDFENLEKFEVSPKAFISSYLVDENRHYFLLDEFQYAKNGGKGLKLLYDTFDNIKFVVTGSSSLELTSQTAKYLVGRMFSFNLHTLSFGEFLGFRDKRLSRIYAGKHTELKKVLAGGSLGEDIFAGEFNNLFEEYLLFGGYPEVAKTSDVETKMAILKNIYETYLTKDIAGLLGIRNVMKFRNIVSTLATHVGGMANYNEISDSCGTYYQELLGLLDALEQTFIIKRVRPFHKNLKTELKKNPKIYFIDLGLRNTIIGDFNPLKTRQDAGNMVENFVLTQLSAEFETIRYWRTAGKAEVDFILESGGAQVPVEVKYKSFKKPNVSRGFRSFLAAYKPTRSIILTKDYTDEIKTEDSSVAFFPVCYV